MWLKLHFPIATSAILAELPLLLHRMAEQDNTVQIVQVAVGVRPIEDMPLLRNVLRAAESVVPQGAPDWIKVYSLSESYLTHFVIFMQMANGQWRKLERNPEKMRDGGVRLTEAPDNLTIGTTLHDRTMIVAIENIAIDLESVETFQKQQETKRYNPLTTNCQHLAWEFFAEFAPRDVPFAFWARQLQNKRKELEKQQGWLKAR